MSRIAASVGLVHDAVDEVTTLIETTHRQSRVLPEALIGGVCRALLGRELPVSLLRRVAECVYASIRFGNALLRPVTTGAAALATALSQKRAAPPSPHPRPVALHARPEHRVRLVGDALGGFLNGVLGDRLHRDNNVLAAAMTLRHRDCYLTPGDRSWETVVSNPSKHAAIFVHGLACTEWAWTVGAEKHLGSPDAHFASLLESDLGVTPFHLRYNSGRRIADNGRELATLLETMLDAYPGGLERLSLIGHSMGGLVLRSALHNGRRAGHRWVQRVGRVVCLGSPHRGSPLARLGRFAEDGVRLVVERTGLPGSSIVGRLLELQGPGIRDLRAGFDHPLEIREDPRLEAPFVRGVPYTLIGSTLSEDPNHPVGRFLGDGIVSASCTNVGTEHPHVQRHVLGGISHLALVTHRRVYEILRDACDPHVGHPRERC